LENGTARSSAGVQGGLRAGTAFGFDCKNLLFVLAPRIDAQVSSRELAAQGTRRVQMARTAVALRIVCLRELPVLSLPRRSLPHDAHEAMLKKKKFFFFLHDRSIFRNLIPPELAA
jgi:hypothetical protein